MFVEKCIATCETWTFVQQEIESAGESMFHYAKPLTRSPFLPFVGISFKERPRQRMEDGCGEQMHRRPPNWRQKGNPCKDLGNSMHLDFWNNKQTFFLQTNDSRAESSFGTPEGQISTTKTTKTTMTGPDQHPSPRRVADLLERVSPRRKCDYRLSPFPCDGVWHWMIGM